MESANGLVVKGRPSTVVPARSTGYNVAHSLNNLDMRMQSHYIRCVYYYSKYAIGDCTTSKLKESLCYVLNRYPVVAGRFSYCIDGDADRPYIKCRDNGIRFIEAECDATLEGSTDFNKDCELQSELCSIQTLGPDPSISPLALIQITRFKCGGISVGLTWAHILGDAFSAAVFMNTWGEIVRGETNISNPPSFQNLLKPPSLHCSKSCEKYIKSRIEESSVHEWATQSKTPLVTATFRFPHAKIEEIQLELARSRVEGSHVELITTPFEVISALMWQIIARIRGPAGPKKVTLCTDSRKLTSRSLSSKSGHHFGNDQLFLDVALEGGDIALVDRGLWYLAMTIHKSLAERVNTQEIDGMVDRLENEKWPPTAMYGSELTFVNWENIPCYDMIINDQDRPSRVSYTVDGMGEKGVVVVLPSAPVKAGAMDRIVSVTLVGKELVRLEEELHRCYSIV